MFALQSVAGELRGGDQMLNGMARMPRTLGVPMPPLNGAASCRIPGWLNAGWPSVLFFVAWVTVGKYIILVSCRAGVA